MKIVLCENPFDLTRDQRELGANAGETLREVMERAELNGVYVVTCNGDVLPTEEGPDFVPQEGDDVQLVPEIQNSTLKTIALIGVMAATAYFTAGLGSFIGGVLFPSLTTAAQNAIAATVLSVGGSLLVSGVASLFQKTPGGAAYGILGPQTTARSGIPIPKGYGTMRSAGNIVESWIDIQGSNGDAHDVDDGAGTIGRQYVNCRVDYGFGPARRFSNLRLNNRDIHEYPDVAYCLLYGTNDQAPVTATDSLWVTLNKTLFGSTVNTQPTAAFNTINNNYPQGQRVRAELAGVIVSGQRDDTEKLTVFVNFPQGVWRYDDSRVIQRLAIDYTVYYRPANVGSAWILGQHHYYYNIRQTPLRQATIIDGLAPGRYDVKVVKAGSGAVFNPLDHFEHESNKFGDELWLESVQETSYTTLAYPNKIQICLRFMASGSLAGSDVNLQADIEYGIRSTLPAELAGLPENVPAVVAYDVMSDDVIGADLDDSRIDLPFLAEWAALTQSMVDDGDGGTQALSPFNGIFDQDGQSVWAVLQSIAAMSRANLQRVGTKITGWLDAPDGAVQVFHVGNILKDSYSKTYLNLEERAQELQVSFSDASDDYRTRNPVRVTTTGTLSSSEATKKNRVSLLGCTDRVQAYYWAALRLAENESILRTHKWKSNVQACRSRTGNVVLLQHDVPQYGWGGLLQPGSDASTLLFDRNELPFDAGSVYNVLVVHPALQRMAVGVTNVGVGNVLTVTGYDGSTPVKRFVQGDIDVAVLSVTPTTLTVDDVTGISVGAGGLWDLDVVETRVVSALDGTKATLATPLSAVPPDYAGFVYQSITKQAKAVRVKEMKKLIGEQRFEFMGVDYDATMYDIPAPTGILTGTTGGGGGTGTGGGFIAGSGAIAHVSDYLPAGSFPIEVTTWTVDNGGSGYHYPRATVSGTLASGYVTDQTVTVEVTGGVITNISNSGATVEYMGIPTISIYDSDTP